MTIKNKRGFTLVEVVVVIAIMAVLMTLAILAINTVRRQARNTQLRNDARTIKAALEAYYGSNRRYIPWYNDKQSAYRVAAPDASDGGLLRAYISGDFPWYRPDSDVMADVCYSYVGADDEENPQAYELWVITEERAADIENTNGNSRKCDEDDIDNVPDNDNFSSN